MRTFEVDQVMFTETEANFKATLLLKKATLFSQLTGRCLELHLLNPFRAMVLHGCKFIPSGMVKSLFPIAAFSKYLFSL